MKRLDLAVLAFELVGIEPPSIGFDEAPDRRPCSSADGRACRAHSVELHQQHACAAIVWLGRRSPASCRRSPSASSCSAARISVPVARPRLRTPCISESCGRRLAAKPMRRAGERRSQQMAPALSPQREGAAIVAAVSGSAIGCGRFARIARRCWMTDRLCVRVAITSSVLGLRPERRAMARRSSAGRKRPGDQRIG